MRKYKNLFLYNLLKVEAVSQPITASAGGSK